MLRLRHRWLSALSALTAAALLGAGTALAQDPYVTVTPGDLLTTPQRYWARPILFKDSLTSWPAGRDVKIDNKRYVPFTTLAAGTCYAAKELVEVLQTLPLKHSYAFNGSVFQFKGRYYVIVQGVTATVDANAMLREMENLEPGEDDAHRDDIVKPIADVIWSVESSHIAFAKEKDIPLCELYDPQSVYFPKAVEMVRSAILDKEQQDKTVSSEMLAQYIILALTKACAATNLHAEPILPEQPATLEPPPESTPAAGEAPGILPEEPVEVPEIMTAPEEGMDSEGEAEGEQLSWWARRRQAAEEKAERKRIAREEELARQTELETERAAERAEQDRLAEQEEERLAAEKAGLERQAQEEARLAEEQRLAEEESRAREEARRQLAEEKAEAKRRAQEAKEAKQKALEQENAERAEQQRLMEEQAEAERQRIAAEEMEQSRRAAEQAEQERLTAEKAERELQAREEAAAEARQKQLAAEKAEMERLAAVQAERERRAREAALKEKAAEEKRLADQRQREEERRRKAELAEQKRLEKEAAVKARAEEVARQKQLAAEKAEEKRRAAEQEAERKAAEETQRAEAAARAEADKAPSEVAAVGPVEEDEVVTQGEQKSWWQRVQEKRAERKRIAAEEAENRRVAWEQFLREEEAQLVAERAEQERQAELQRTAREEERRQRAAERAERERREKELEAARQKAWEEQAREQESVAADRPVATPPPVVTTTNDEPSTVEAIDPRELERLQKIEEQKFQEFWKQMRRDQERAEREQRTLERDINRQMQRYSE